MKVVDCIVRRAVGKECPTCRGTGHTKATVPVYGPKKDAPGGFGQTVQGSGCPTCHGTGRINQ